MHRLARCSLQIGGRPEAYDIRAEALAASNAAPADVEKAIEDALAHGSRSACTVWQDAAFRSEAGGKPMTSAPKRWQPPMRHRPTSRKRSKTRWRTVREAHAPSGKMQP